MRNEWLRRWWRRRRRRRLRRLVEGYDKKERKEKTIRKIKKTDADAKKKKKNLRYKLSINTLPKKNISFLAVVQKWPGGFEKSLTKLMWIVLESKLELMENFQEDESIFREKKKKVFSFFF